MRHRLFPASALASCLFAASLSCAPSLASAQAVDAKILPLTAFAPPSAALTRACMVGSESALAQRAILGLKGGAENSADSSSQSAPNDMEGLVDPAAKPASGASDASAPSGDAGSSLALQSGGCRSMEERAPDAANAPLVAEIPPFDFTEQNGEIQAVGPQGPAGSLRARSGGSAFSLAFWKAGAPKADQSANTYAIGSRFILFGRPGALYAFDRQTQQFCPNAVEQPASAFDRTLREMPNGSLLLSVWTPGAKDEGPKLNARVLDPDALCPRSTPPAQ